MTEETIQLIDNRQPVLKTGKYQLEITLDNPAAGASADAHLTIKRNFTIPGGESGGQVSFSLEGEAAPITLSRFTVSAADIQAVFPPADNQGDHSRVLAHVIFKNSSLPWACRAVPDRDEIPWLALLLFDECEAPAQKPISLGELSTPGEKPAFPPFIPAPGQDSRTPLNVIDVRRDLLEQILPSGNDLKFLAHVRQGEDQSEVAVVTCNRLPNPGGKSVVHLVSLEGRYLDDGTFDYQAASQPGDLVRLISLHNWRFSCKDAQQTFSQLLLNLDSGLLRLPKNANRDAEKYLAQGCAPLRHTTRQGTRTVSWYHGPLVPASNRAELPREAVRASDQLVRFNRELGFFDVSYAAAWELGRLLALQSKTFSAALFGWKRSQVQGLQAQAFRGKKDGGVDSTSQAVGLPSSVKEWFERIQLLEGIPLNYLIPDERMLPPAAIRFFSVDWYWLECLQTGAFSLGRPTKWDECLLTALPEPSRKTSGFVLRSDVVAGWPGLVVSVETPAKLLRMGRLSDDVLICLFDGEPGAVNFHLKPETLHFELGKARLPIEKIPWQREAACRVIATEKLAIHALKTDSPAQFAAKMLADGDDVQLMAWQKKTDG